jgi:hypothetical protein
MKTPIGLHLIAAGFAFGLFVSAFAATPAPVTSTSIPATAPVPAAGLLLRVDVPAAWSPLVEDDIAQAFAGLLQESFRRRGYRGTVELRHSVDPAPGAGQPLLAVSLQEWRLNRMGQADCSFRATLTVGGKELDLGLFLGTKMHWVQTSSRWGLARDLEVADALEDAASDALTALHRKIAETHAVPGIEPSRK